MEEIEEEVQKEGEDVIMSIRGGGGYRCDDNAAGGRGYHDQQEPEE